MRTLTTTEARDLLGGPPDTFIAELLDRLEFAKGPFSTPANSGVQIALSRLFAYLSLRHSPVCLYVTGWSVAPSAELLDLFYGYRRSMGETRPLIEAPFHIFEHADEDAMVSVLSMVFFFAWDAWLFDTAGRIVLRVSHDGWLEIQADDEKVAQNVADELESYGIARLGRR